MGSAGLQQLRVPEYLNVVAVSMSIYVLFVRANNVTTELCAGTLSSIPRNLRQISGFRGKCNFSVV
jgi:hypothetical protein